MNAEHGTRLEIPYTSRDFPSGLVPAEGCLSADWSDLLWAALTVGRPKTAHVFAHGRASCYEALFRLSLVRMALEHRSFSRSLHRTDAFRSLDPTEKGAVTYFLGMAICTLFSSSFLHTDFLLHLDVFRDRLNPGLLGGRSRPDLVGQDATGAWHAFECKGRSSVPNADDMRKAKTQAQRLVCVNSTACTLHVGAISYFRQDALEFHWRDPAPEGSEPRQPIEVPLPDDPWSYHYALPLAMAEQADARADADINIEVHEAVLEPLRARDWAAARSQTLELGPALREEGFRPDGLKVIAGESWRRVREM